MRWTKTSTINPPHRRAFRLALPALLLLVYSSSVFSAGYSIDASGVPDYINIPTASFVSSDFNSIIFKENAGAGVGALAVSLQMSYMGLANWNGQFSSPYYNYKNWVCPSSLVARETGSALTIPEQLTFISWLNSRIRSDQPTLTNYASKPTIPITDIGPAFASGWSCTFANSSMGIVGTSRSGIVIDVVVPPPGAPSVCTFVTPSIVFDYKAFSMDVTGINQSTNLGIKCSNSSPVDYKLSLSSPTQINGRLSFGNGVTVQMSLDSVPLIANGPAIPLRGLITGNRILSGGLFGTAESSDVKNTTGILTLEPM